MSLEKEFVSYDLALELKDLGFEEECFACYLDDKYLNVEYCKKQFHFHGQVASAPLWQQAFRWFREKYKLLSFVDIDATYRIYCDDIKFDLDIDSRIFKTYEEAEVGCLKKLIEIVKERK